MGKNLRGKTVAIIAILIIFIYGIFFGMNPPRLGSLKTLITNNIHMGLDLKGGTHLVLQVHVAEAINTATDRDMQSLTTALATSGATAAKLDPSHPDVITITGVTPTQQSSVHDTLTGNSYAIYDVASTSGGYTMTLKQTADAVHVFREHQRLQIHAGLIAAAAFKIALIVVNISNATAHASGEVAAR